METQEIYSVLKSGSSEQIKSLINTAPNSNMKKFVLDSSNDSNFAHLIITLSNLIMDYCNGKDPEYGVKLADAVHQFALDIFTEQEHHGGLLKITLSSLAVQHLNALNQLGQYQQVLTSVDNYLSVYQEMNEMENYPFLVKAKTNALSYIKQYDKDHGIADDWNNNQQQFESNNQFNPTKEITIKYFDIIDTSELLGNKKIDETRPGKRESKNTPTKNPNIGSRLFNPPTEMRVGNVYRIVVRISRDDKIKINQFLTEQGASIPSLLKISQYMTIKLSGHAFSIKSYNTPDKFIPKNDYSEWVWDVTPLKSGKKYLRLLVSICLKLTDGEESKDHPISIKSISVAINPANFIKRLLQNKYLWIAALAFTLLVLLLIFL